MRAKKWTSFRRLLMKIAKISISCGVIINLTPWALSRLHISLPEVNFGELVMSATLIGVLAGIAMKFFGSLCNVSYSLIRGMNIMLNDSYAVAYRLVPYQLSHLHENQDNFTQQWIARLYLTMSLEELMILLQEQWTSVWFSGRAVLSVKLAIPGRNFPTLYICRSTLKQIARETRQLRQDAYVQLQFEFCESGRFGRMSYEYDRFLMSMWDVAELRTIFEGQIDIRLSDGHAEYQMSWYELEKHERTLTEDYQIIDLYRRQPQQ